MRRSSRRLRLREPVASVVPPEPPGPKLTRENPWWRRTGARVGAAIGAVVLSVVTGVALKYSDMLTSPIVRAAAGAPVYVSAVELIPDLGGEPLARMLANGVDDQDRRLLAGGISGAGPNVDVGIPVGIGKYRVVVQAKDSRLLLIGLRLVVDQRRAPLRGTLVAAGSQGGAGTPIQVLFDADDPRATTPNGVDARNFDGQDYFGGNNYELDPGQSVEFRASVTTRRCDCRWHIEVAATLDGKIYSVPVRSSDGADFEVTSATPAAHDVYELPMPSEPPGTVLGTIGPWAKVLPAAFCSASSSLSTFCDPATWP